MLSRAALQLCCIIAPMLHEVVAPERIWRCYLATDVMLVL